MELPYSWGRHAVVRPHDPVRASAHADWLETLRASFEDRILEVDDAVTQAWGGCALSRPFRR